MYFLDCVDPHWVPHLPAARIVLEQDASRPMRQYNQRGNSVGGHEHGHRRHHRLLTYAGVVEAADANEEEDRRQLSAWAWARVSLKYQRAHSKTPLEERGDNY